MASIVLEPDEFDRPSTFVFTSSGSATRSWAVRDAETTPGGETRLVINWEDNPARTERGIQMLLRKLYPGLRSLDGAGGDGGRDAQLITADGNTVFEVKSFGRLTGSRRRQVQNSLRQAVRSVPDMNRWVLVIPMNMTPARPGVRSSEETWFDENLPGFAPGVELSWWGQDWLDGQLAENMDIQRYIEGVDGQLMERAREFKMEQEVLADGANDLGSRLDGLRSRVDEVSPYWTLDFSDIDGLQATILRAKTPTRRPATPSPSRLRSGSGPTTQPTRSCG